ncbi:MAG: DegV family protein [Clostridiales bacterium]|nr:DegV family protein [Clostridiales bacterium]
MTNNVKITTDSASDLNELFKTREIGEFPLYVMLGENQYLDDENIKPTQIFEYYEKTGELPKTAARSIEDFYEYFKSFTDEGLAVVHIAISSQISSTYEYAEAAAKKLENVYVVDGRSLSSGTGLLALAAADLRDNGIDAPHIAQTLEARKKEVQASFMINTLDFLYKGGRCSGLSAFFGKAFSIKPTLQLIDGKITVARKFLGNFNKNIVKYVDHTLQKYNRPDMTRVFITHTFADETAVAAVRARLIDYGFAPENIIETIAGSTITSHCGKSTLGILYINDGNKK